MSNNKGFILWFTGLSGAGKSTLAEYLTPILRERGVNVEVLDGDVVRTNLSKGLGFSKEDRDTNIRRIGFVANLLARNGACAITAAISPYQEIRDECRNMADADFIEVFVEAPLEVVEERDTKGLYKKARSGEIKNFTGVSDPYEAPKNPEVVVHTGSEDIETSANKILDYLVSRGLVSSTPAGAGA
ncbi:MAG TPA: adenylyl-sulfate kinase [Planctomycetaceae bacterium]|nr:adenylyl-sulfate kinase [Planctomycetaceae bacterium]